MRSILKKVVFSAAIATVAAFAADNSLGTWKLNMKKSKFGPDWPIKSLTTMRQASNAPEYYNGQLVGTVGVTERTMGKQADGSPIAINYTVKYSGHSIL
jgi:hypothetical protein